VFGAQVSPWQTTSRSIGGMSEAASASACSTEPNRALVSSCHSAVSIRPAAAFAVAVASRVSIERSKGHSSTGRFSCRVRSPAPIARTAVAGSFFHRASTAERPGSPAVTNHEPWASEPCASTRGTLA
jgi:hypothetical protein